MKNPSGLIILLLVAALFSFLSPPLVQAEDWPQDAHDAQRSGSTTEDPGNGSRWSFAWFWQSPANANPPREGRSVTGGGKLYLPAGSSGLYALNLTNGSQSWRITGTFNAAVAYLNGFIYAGSSDGNLYKINASTGSVVATFAAGSALNKAVLVANDFLYVGAEGGTIFKIRSSDMTSVWQYSTGSPVDTPIAYSAQGILVLATRDLYIHAISDSTGNRLWRVKPSPNSPGSQIAGGWNTYNWGWPVIAEKHGLVLLRQQLPHNPCLYGYSGSTGSIWPNSLTTSQQFLTNNPDKKSLFVLDLSTGAEKFIPAVGCGSTEWILNGTTFGVMGTQPVIKTWPNGDEVAYLPFRNGQNNPPDGRWDGHLGEMVLDAATVPGLPAGHLRFVRMSSYNGYGGNSYIHVVDEQAPITLAGSSLFHAHWGASEGVVITDRSTAKGLTYANPISSSNLPAVIRRLGSCSNYNSASHMANCGLTLYQDGHYWNGPGWAMYSSMIDPPGPNASNSYSAGFLPRYTYVSGGYVIIEGNGGDILALAHGSAANPTLAPTLPTSPSSTPAPAKPGDADGNGRVNGSDYVIWLRYYGQDISGPAHGDFNSDNKVNGSDYVIWLNNYSI